MKLDNTSFAFGFSVKTASSTPNWATALGQGSGYKINVGSSIDEILKGLVYTAVPVTNVKMKIGKGGASVTGADPKSPIIIAGLFTKVYVNDSLINGGRFLLVITRDDSATHAGRLRLKYSPHNTLLQNGNELFTNSEFIEKAKEQLGLAEDACWFIYDISVFDQDKLYLSSIIVDKNGSRQYDTPQQLRDEWNSLLPHETSDSLRQSKQGRVSTSNLPFNKIYFGAPGTGKSYKLQEDSEVFENCNTERVTFYPSYSFAQFVGTYKPITEEGEEGKIRYDYVPGPFVRMLVEAYKHPNQDYLLIIEELNRANAPAVFGDLFQLLDRLDDGTSEYPIAVSEDLKKHLKKENVDRIQLSLPSNLYIWATMNSADQGVFPIDTAFKRRWDFEYLGINQNENIISGFEVVLGGRKYNWNILRKAINAMLVASRINEDKLLGPFFLKPHIFDDNETFIKAFKSKVIMYLFEDAARQARQRVFNAIDENMTYSFLCEQLDAIGPRVFKLKEELTPIVEQEQNAL